MQRVRSEIYRLTDANRHALIRQWRWLYLQQKTAIPAPLAFFLSAAATALTAFFTLPHHPMSIPIAAGSGLSFALIFEAVRR